ncbi:MAG: PHP domain-containing protein [Candidatus Eisenbacteria bacterium]|nr:PHP domain-containing protein [Candidatus Eisenbacteria bacterium]
MQEERSRRASLSWRPSSRTQSPIRIWRRGAGAAPRGRAHRSRIRTMQQSGTAAEIRRRITGALGLRADLHVHSSYSHDVPGLPAFSPRALYDLAVERGMGLFTLTDHDTLDGFLALQRELRSVYGNHPPIPLISGVELKVCDPAVGHTIHLNVLGLTQEQMIDLMRRAHNVEAFVGYCRDRGLFHVYNHPFWFERGERANLGAVESLIERLPVIELNAGRIRELNARTEELARRYSKPVVAASDTHTGQIGKSFTVAPGKSAAEFLENVLGGQAQVFPQHIAFREFLAEISLTVDLFLQGMTRQAELPLPKGIDPRTEFWGRMLGRRWLFQRPLTRRGLGAIFKLLARPPAQAFIREQHRMLLRLDEGQC